MNEWGAKLRAWLRGRQGIDSGLQDEMDAHFQMEMDAAMENGLSAAEAKQLASQRFGNRTAAFENAREAWGFPSLESIWQDLRLGVRAMRRAPGFAAIVTLTIALGVGVNTAVFSVVHAVLMKPLPLPESERLVVIGESTGQAFGISVTWGNYTHWREESHSFDRMAAYRFDHKTLTGRDEPLTLRGLYATAGYFPLAGFRPFLGRLLNEADNRPGAAATVVLNRGFWLTKLGGDPKIIGSAVILDGKPYTVVGVAAPAWEQRPFDYYLPLGASEAATIGRTQHGSIRVLARLKPGITMQAARADLDRIMERLAISDPGPETSHRSAPEFLAQSMVAGVRKMLWMLMGAATLILLIATANVASLLFARNTTRYGELALRTAIGAGRLRLVRQLITENLVLTIAGGALGILFSVWTIRALVALRPGNLPRLAEVAIDPAVLFFACAISIVTGLVANLAPVFGGGRIDVSSALKDAVRSVSGNKQRQLFRNAFVVSEIALTLVLAFAAGLLLRSLLNAQNTSPGFPVDHLLTVELLLPDTTYKTPDSIRNVYARLAEEFRSIPGVASVTSVHCPPSAGDCGDWFYSIPGKPAPSRNEVPIALFNMASDGYFRVMGIPIKQGREFQRTDLPLSAKVAVVNETFARSAWPGENAVGKQIKVGGPYIDGPVLEVVGVAGDVKQEGLDSESLPEVFQPITQATSAASVFLVRTGGSSDAIASALRRAVTQVDRDLPIQRISTMEENFGAGLARRRFTTFLLVTFASLAMLLAAIGIYGLLSYWVSIREPEIAIRVAVGARQFDIARWTAGHVLRLACAGVSFGLFGAWASMRMMEGFLYGLTARSASTLLFAVAAVLLLAIVAAAVPVLRASRLDVSQRLHHV